MSPDHIFIKLWPLVGVRELTFRVVFHLGPVLGPKWPPRAPGTLPGLVFGGFLDDFWTILKDFG